MQGEIIISLSFFFLSVPGCSAPTILGVSSAMTDKYFCGRDREVRKLTQRIAEMPGSVLALVGPPGFGKTSLAVVVGQQVHTNNKMDVIFLDLRGVTTTQAIERLLCINLTKSSAQGDSLENIAKSITSPTLLIFDNVEDCLNENNHLRFAELLQRVLAGSESLRALITSRVSFLTRIPHVSPKEYRIGSIPGEEAVALLSKLCHCQKDSVSIEPGVAAAIVYWCGAVPLAIRLVSTLLLNGPLSPAELLEDFESSGITALESDEYTDWPERRLLAVLEKTITALPEALLNDLEGLAQYETSFPVDAAAATLGLDKAAAISLKKRLIPLEKQCMLEYSKGTDRYSIHPFIAMFIRDRAAKLKPETAKLYQARLCLYFTTKLLEIPQKAAHPTDCSLAVKFLQVEITNIATALKHLDKLDTSDTLPIARFLANFFPAALLLRCDVMTRDEVQRLVDVCIEAAQTANDTELKADLLLLHAWGLRLSGTRDGIDLSKIAREQVQQAMQVVSQARLPDDTLLAASCHLMAAFVADTKAERLAAATRARDLVVKGRSRVPDKTTGSPPACNDGCHELPALVMEMLAWLLMEQYEESAQLCVSAIQAHHLLASTDPSSIEAGLGDRADIRYNWKNIKFAFDLAVYMKELAYHRPQVLLTVMPENGIECGERKQNFLQHVSSLQEVISQLESKALCPAIVREVGQEEGLLNDLHRIVHIGYNLEVLRGGPIAALCSAAFHFLINPSSCRLWPASNAFGLCTRSRYIPAESTQSIAGSPSVEHSDAVELSNDLKRLSPMQRHILELRWKVDLLVMNV